MLPSTCSVTHKRLNIKHLAKIRVGVFATLKTPKTLIYSLLRAAPNATLTSSPSFSHSCLSLHVPTSLSTLQPVTPRSHLPLYAPTCHSTLLPVTPRSHQSLPRSHLSLPPASPLSPLHAHRRYPHAHIEAQPELGTRLGYNWIS